LLNPINKRKTKSQAAQSKSFAVKTKSPAAQSNQ
jgi:hypothetical protein